MTLPSAVNIKASTINKEVTFGATRQFSYSQYWPNVIEKNLDQKLSFQRMLGKTSAYNVYASGYMENFPYNSTPVIRISNNGFNDGDIGLFDMSDDDWFSVDVAFIAENRSLISNEVFRVFFKNNSNNLSDIPFIKDPVHTIAQGYTPAREWVALDNQVIVDLPIAASKVSVFEYPMPLSFYYKDNYEELKADTDAYKKAVQFNYGTGFIDCTIWVATYVEGFTRRILRRYTLMDTNTNSYNWVAIGAGNPDTNFQILSTYTATDPVYKTTANYVGGISGDYDKLYQEAEPLPRGGPLYGYNVGDIIYKRERSPDGPYQWTMYQLESINLRETEPTTKKGEGANKYGGSKTYTLAKLKTITNEIQTYNASVKQWVRAYSDVTVTDNNKIVTSLPFADNYNVGNVIYLYFFNTTSNRWQYDQYKLISSTSPYEPNDRYEDFENYGNFQTNYYGFTSRKLSSYDPVYRTTRGCQVYEWKGNAGYTNKNKWVLTTTYDPSLRVGSPTSYADSNLPNPNTLSVGTTILYKPFSATEYDYYTVAPDTSNVKNITCRVYYHPLNKEVWASAQYVGPTTPYSKCQVIIRRITYWPYGTSTKDQLWPNYYTYTGQKIATTADGINQKILDLFDEIYFRPPDLETATSLQASLNSGQYTLDDIRNQMNNVTPTNQPWNSRIFNTNQKLRVKMAKTWEDYNQKYVLANGTEIKTHVNGYDDVKWYDKTIGTGTHNGIPPNVRTTVSNLEWNFYINPAPF